MKSKVVTIVNVFIKQLIENELEFYVEAKGNFVFVDGNKKAIVSEKDLNKAYQFHKEDRK